MPDSSSRKETIDLPPVEDTSQFQRIVRMKKADSIVPYTQAIGTVLGREALNLSVSAEVGPQRHFLKAQASNEIIFGTAFDPSEVLDEGRLVGNLHFRSSMVRAVSRSRAVSLDVFFIAR